MGGWRKPLKASVWLGRLAMGPVSLLVSPVAGCQEVGVSGSSLEDHKTPANMCFVFRERCQILALEIIFQVLLQAKKKEKSFHLEKEGGRKYEDQKGIAKLAENSKVSKNQRGALSWGACSKDRGALFLQKEHSEPRSNSWRSAGHTWTAKHPHVCPEDPSLQL